MLYGVDVCVKDISYMKWGDICGNSIEHPYSILAMLSVSRQHLSMYNYPEDDKPEFVGKVNNFSC